MNQPKTLTPSHLEKSGAPVNLSASGLPAVPMASLEAVQRLKRESRSIEYRPYPHKPTYIIGSDGSVWSTVKRTDSGVAKNREKPLRLRVSLAGKYQKVSICGKTIHVHVLVLETFSGRRPLGFQAAHGNGVPTDNEAKNLRWATVKQNHQDKKIHGTMPIGEKCYNAILKETDCIEILSKLSAGISQSKIAKQYGVCRGAITSISLGKTWRHIRRLG